MLKSFKLSATVLAIFILILVMYSVSFASESSTAPNTLGPGIAIILFFICYNRRRHEIGGWYLYYIIQLFIAIAFYVFTSIYAISSYNPANYQNFGYFLLFLLADLPTGILLIGQAIIAGKMISESGRDWKFVKILILILWGDLIFSALRVVIDLIISPADIVFAIIALIWPVIWLPYFIRSKRIQKIYKTKNWGLEILKDYVPDAKDFQDPDKLA